MHEPEGPMMRPAYLNDEHRLSAAQLGLKNVRRI